MPQKSPQKNRMPVQLKVEQTMRNLGADFASGAKCQGRERRARVAKARKRCNRLEAIKLAGIQTERFHTVALLSVGSYAADVNGISNSALHQLRLVAARATAGKAAGRNLVLTLATAKNAKYDPAFRANTAPVRAWASAVWTGGQHTASLKAAYEASKGVLGWNAIEGPAGATLMTLKRIGWRHTAWDNWITDQDVQINLNRFCPKTVERLVVDATERACQREVAKQMGLPRLSNGILLEPILQLIRKTHGTEDKPWGRAEAAHLRSTVVGGQWPQIGSTVQAYRQGNTALDVTASLELSHTVTADALLSPPSGERFSQDQRWRQSNKAPTATLGGRGAYSHILGSSFPSPNKGRKES